jgi:hypothetical protein
MLCRTERDGPQSFFCARSTGPRVNIHTVLQFILSPSLTNAIPLTLVFSSRTTKTLHFCRQTCLTFSREQMAVVINLLIIKLPLNVVISPLYGKYHHDGSCNKKGERRELGVSETRKIRSSRAEAILISQFLGPERAVAQKNVTNFAHDRVSIESSDLPAQIPFEKFSPKYNNTRVVNK